ncbi:ABC transporter permease [Rhodococcus sp. 1168]|uniref:ABC transporter permease n=1 Tax=Rhodococcus sp. 1168 TaxID=2018041 RepID=UPI000B5AD5E4|nr:ABC transporter permease [Rhodococcus sp. 1168]
MRLCAALASAARAAVVLVAVSIIVFAVIALLPGDAVSLRAAGRITPEQLSTTRSASGLDDPLTARYFAWLRRIATGDLGTSTSTGRSVASMLGNRLAVSASIVFVALVIVIPLMGVLAVLTSHGAGRRSAGVAAMTAVAALPQIVVAALGAAILSGWAGLVPPVSLLPRDESPLAHLDLLLLPALTLALPASAYGALMLRGPLVDAAATAYIVDARMRGVGRMRLAGSYLFPVVVAPAVRVLSFILAGLVGGTALVEKIFGLSGLGELFVTSIATRDVPVVQAISMLAATVAVVGMTVADVVAARTTKRDAT